MEKTRVCDDVNDNVNDNQPCSKKRDDSDSGSKLYEGMLSVDESLETKGIVFLEDEEKFPGASLYAKKLIMDLATNGKIGYPIKVYINSTGGCLATFIAVHDTILIAQNVFGIKVDTIVCGSAMSGAALVLQAGSTRYATENSYIMIHEASFDKISGNASSIEEDINSIKKLQNIALSVWASKMGITVKELAKLISNKDVYFSAKEAKKHGLIDKIV